MSTYNDLENVILHFLKENTILNLIDLIKLIESNHLDLYTKYKNEFSSFNITMLLDLMVVDKKIKEINILVPDCYLSPSKIDLEGIKYKYISIYCDKNAEINIY